MVQFDSRTVNVFVIEATKFIFFDSDRVKAALFRFGLIIKEWVFKNNAGIFNFLAFFQPQRWIQFKPEFFDSV